MDDNTARMAGMTLKMLQRVDLKGSEVPAFVEVNNWLQDMIKSTPPQEKVPDVKN